MKLEKQIIHNESIQASVIYDVDFEIGEKVDLIHDHNLNYYLDRMYKINPTDKIVDIRISEGACQTGIEVKLERYGESYVSAGWIKKIEP
jgi:hypothetical protein